MQLRVRAGASLKPKHHWAFDVAECLASDESKFLLDTFGTERMHRRAKSVAENCTRLDVFEVYVMSGLVNMHLNYNDAAWREGIELVGNMEAIADTLIVSSGVSVKGELLRCDEFCSRGWIGMVAIWVDRDGGRGARVADAMRVKEGWWVAHTVERRYRDVE